MLNRIQRLLIVFPLLLPYVAHAESIDTANPWDHVLYALLQMMTGPTASTVGAIALASTGYLFLRGRLDMMRLLTIIIGLGLIFGAPHLVFLLQQHTG